MGWGCGGGVVCALWGGCWACGGPFCWAGRVFVVVLVLVRVRGYVLLLMGQVVVVRYMSVVLRRCLVQHRVVMVVCQMVVVGGVAVVLQLWLVCHYVLG